MEAGTVASRVGPLLAAFALPVDFKPAAAAPDPGLAVRAKVEATVPMTGMPSVTQAAFAAPVYPPAPPPKKLFVRIEGMDDGVRDIPYSDKP